MGEMRLKIERRHADLLADVVAATLAGQRRILLQESEILEFVEMQDAGLVEYRAIDSEVRGKKHDSWAATMRGRAALESWKRFEAAAEASGVVSSPPEAEAKGKPSPKPRKSKWKEMPPGK